MNIARHIALIDELCFRPFTAERTSSNGDESGPGYHVVVLESGHDNCGTRAETMEQYEKYRDALDERFATRWRETGPYNLQTVSLRTEQEEIPEPWASLSARARVASVWEVEGTGRWVAAVVADLDEADDVKLLGVVTEIDPP
ncbi:hypothetical protein [Streptomyces caeruleatus]|uniref:Uncharacterized protein n=1 Tax=Streptomyces caeruleatus TaxID=661399 RepID=A0A101TR03_9ACTN|nr:hypothetical protein [Streptomyces caeruleatus]KUN96849.1 hypothetical protein AQJ67_32260 [Streptomyces caeruleatus]